MSDDNETPAAAATASEARGVLSEQEWRTLILAIAGGLAANLATVILVGVALVFVHWRRGHVSAFPALILAVAALGVVAVGHAMRKGNRASKAYLGLQSGWGGLLILGFGWLCFLIAVLAWIGLAAGVK